MGVDIEIISPGDDSTYPKAGQVLGLSTNHYSYQTTSNYQCTLGNSKAIFTSALSRGSWQVVVDMVLAQLKCHLHCTLNYVGGLLQSLVYVVCSKFQTVTCHYVLTLTNGKKIDSSRDRGKPFQFKVGRGEVRKLSFKLKCIIIRNFTLSYTTNTKSTCIIKTYTSTFYVFTLCTQP